MLIYQVILMMKKYLIHYEKSNDYFFVLTKNTYYISQVLVLIGMKEDCLILIYPL